MRRPFLTALASLMLAIPGAMAGDAPDPASPEAQLLGYIHALKDNDFKKVFATFPADAQAKAQEQWKSAQTATPIPESDQKFDDTLTMLLAPDAIDQLMAKAQPAMQFDPAKAGQNMMMMAGFLPMILAQKVSQPLTVSQQAMMTQVQNLITDIAQWLPTAGLNDTNKLKEALTHVIAGVKSLGFKNAVELRKLSLDEVLARLGPCLKELKQGFAVYDLQFDHWLGSFTATSAPTTAATTTAPVTRTPVGGVVGPRTLSLGFTAFGRQYEMALPMVNKDGHWSVSPDAVPGGVDEFKTMLGLPGAPAPITVETVDPPGPAPAPGEGKKSDTPPAKGLKTPAP